MGGALSSAANGVGGFLGNVFTAPFKAILGRSCEDICSGPWDLPCFIEHLCISDLGKLLMISGLCYIILIFFYLMFKVGICQCVVKSLCKMCWAACETYWCSIIDMTCFLWHKLASTRRVSRRRQHRRRFVDIEAPDYSSSNGERDDHNHLRLSRKRSREERMSRQRSGRRVSHRMKLSRRDASFHVRCKSRRGRNPRKLQLSRERKKPGRGVKSFKKRRVS